MYFWTYEKAVLRINNFRRESFLTYLSEREGEGRGRERKETREKRESGREGEGGGELPTGEFRVILKNHLNTVFLKQPNCFILF